nr:RNA-directed DNA polymerase, eukaryota [Tanacetum cinerariifolium]
MLKKEIRTWTLDYKRQQVGHSKDLKSKLSDIDKMGDQGGVTHDILLSRMEVLKQLHDVQSLNNRDIMQKAKIRCAIEGDENSKYFHAIINKKRVNLSVKGVALWFRRLCNAQSDFAAKERIILVDIKGVPLNAWSRSTFQNIASKWGEMVELEDGYDDLFARKRICIKTSQTENILESFKIIVKGKVFWARAKELFVWSPSFKEVPEKVICSDDESVKINEEANSLNNGVEESDTNIKQDAPEVESDRPPNRSERSNSRVLEEVSNSVDKSSSESINNGIKLKEGGFILEILEEMITVGQTIGFSMEGCTKDMEKIIGTQGEQVVFR